MQLVAPHFLFDVLFLSCPSMIALHNFLKKPNPTKSTTNASFQFSSAVCLHTIILIVCCLSLRAPFHMEAFPLELRPSLHKAAKAVNFSSRFDPASTSPSSFKTVSWGDNTSTAKNNESKDVSSSRIAGVGVGSHQGNTAFYDPSASSLLYYPVANAGNGSSNNGHDLPNRPYSSPDSGGGPQGVGGAGGSRRDSIVIPSQWRSSTVASTTGGGGGGGGGGLESATAMDSAMQNDESSAAASAAGRRRGASIRFDIEDDDDEATLHHHFDSKTGRHTVTKEYKNQLFRSVAKGLVSDPKNAAFEDAVDRQAWEQPSTVDKAAYFYEKGVGGYMVKHVEFEPAKHQRRASPSSSHVEAGRGVASSGAGRSRVVIKAAPHAPPRQGSAAATRSSGYGQSSHTSSFGPAASAGVVPTAGSNRIHTTASLASRYPLTVAVREHLRNAGDVCLLFESTAFGVGSPGRNEAGGVNTNDPAAADANDALGDEDFASSTLNNFAGIGGHGGHHLMASAASCQRYQRLNDQLLMVFPESLYIFPSERIRVAYITDVTVHLNCNCPFPCLELKILASLPQGVQKRRRQGGESSPNPSPSPSPHRTPRGGGGGGTADRPPFNNSTKNASSGRGGREGFGTPSRGVSAGPAVTVTADRSHSAKAAAAPTFERLSDREIVAQLSTTQLEQQRYYTRIVGFSSEVVLKEAVAILSDMCRYSPTGLRANAEDVVLHTGHGGGGDAASAGSSAAVNAAPAMTCADVRARRIKFEQQNSKHLASAANRSSLSAAHHPHALHNLRGGGVPSSQFIVRNGGTFYTAVDEIPAAPLLRLSFHARHWGDGEVSAARTVLGATAAAAAGPIDAVGGEGADSLALSAGRPQQRQHRQQQSVHRVDALRSKLALFRRGRVMEEGERERKKATPAGAALAADASRSGSSDASGGGGESEAAVMGDAARRRARQLLQLAPTTTTAVGDPHEEKNQRASSPPSSDPPLQPPSINLRTRSRTRGMSLMGQVQNALQTGGGGGASAGRAGMGGHTSYGVGGGGGGVSSMDSSADPAGSSMGGLADKLLGDVGDLMREMDQLLSITKHRSNKQQQHQQPNASNSGERTDYSAAPIDHTPMPTRNRSLSNGSSTGGAAAQTLSFQRQNSVLSSSASFISSSARK